MLDYWRNKDKTVYLSETIHGFMAICDEDEKVVGVVTSEDLDNLRTSINMLYPPICE